MYNLWMLVEDPEVKVEDLKFRKMATISNYYFGKTLLDNIEMDSDELSDWVWLEDVMSNEFKGKTIIWGICDEDQDPMDGIETSASQLVVLIVTSKTEQYSYNMRLVHIHTDDLLVQTTVSQVVSFVGEFSVRPDKVYVWNITTGSRVYLNDFSKLETIYESVDKIL